MSIRGCFIKYKQPIGSNHTAVSLNQNRSDKSNPICEAGLESLVGDTFVQSVVHYQQTDSTNTRAIELLAAEDAVSSPCLVYSESQTAGRGRGGNQWWSASGSLTFSLIIDSNQTALSAEQIPLLPLLTGMAILRTGQSLLPDGAFQLKWPNDVFLADRKLAGVLIEVPSQSSGHAVIGVGLNVNNSFANAPEQLAETGTSLADQSPTDYRRIEVLRTFMQEFELLLESFAAGSGLIDQWPDYCLLTGKQVTLRTGSTTVTGRCQGIDSSGALLMQTETGEQRFCGGVVESWV